MAGKREQTSGTLPKFKELRRPTNQEIEFLKELSEFSPEEKKYWDDMVRRVDSQTGEEDYKGRIEFYTGELKAIKGRFDGIIVERLLKYNLALSYEYLATRGMGDSPTEGGDAKERARTFQEAVKWYQAADEALGFHTNYAFRQFESCLGAAHFSSKSLDNELADWYANRAEGLLGIMLGPAAKVNVIDKETGDEIKLLADKKIEGGVVEAHLFMKSDPAKDN